MRGYFGVALWHPKESKNVGGLWRSAHVFGAAFLATIGKRYHREPPDTSDAASHVPLLAFEDYPSFEKIMMFDVPLVVVERTPSARHLSQFTHPESAVYLFGPESGSVPDEIQAKADYCITIPYGEWSLNLASAGSIIMYDRVSR